MKADTVRIRTKGHSWEEKPSHFICTGTHLQFQARLAIDIVNRFALVAGTPDGEDSAGRQKLRLAEPAELVTRACDLAEQMVGEFEKRGWVLELPDLEDE